nr:MAG TPA: hypothetical protein [Caudoviricetes sp.]
MALPSRRIFTILARGCCLFYLLGFLRPVALK